MSTTGRKRAVSLLELTIVMIILGILAAIAMPMFSRTMEATKAKEAVAALQQIRTGERIYRVEENAYWQSSGAGVAEIQQINTQLRLDLKTTDDRSWDYSVGTATSVAFTATAKRLSGGYQDETITINQNGVFGGTWPLPIPGQ